MSILGRSDLPWAFNACREPLCCGNPGNCGQPETCEQALRAQSGEAWFEGLPDDWREQNPGPW